jgi:uncharacterized membrane protein
MAESNSSGASETTRVEAFSDGIFAIAITLLVLEIRVPPADLTGHGTTLLPALLRLWPSYLGYLISFITIGIMWVNHHSMFMLIRRIDRYFLLLSVVFLMFIAFLPFTTAVLAEYLSEPKGRQIALASYSATFVLIALAYNAVWWYAARGGRLLDEAADRGGTDHQPPVFDRTHRLCGLLRAGVCERLGQPRGPWISRCVLRSAGAAAHRSASGNLRHP